MRNLVVCADGTWNTPDDKDGGLPAPTNVAKLFNALQTTNAAGVEQKKYYHPGVGTDGGWWERLAGGGAGEGLSQNVMSGYKWLATHYAPGDSIFLFGFSRGAYTVRSLGGIISRCGLLNLSDANVPDAETWDRVQKVFDCYRDKANNHDKTRLREFAFFNAPDADHAPESTPIHFVGVWDTVGALGIPDDLALLNLIDDPKRYQFHDTGLSDIVEVARHAVAMDEMRKSFAPTLWTYAEGRDVKQIWFPGVHSDVGGGYRNIGLSNAALLWMVNEAANAGLGFRKSTADRVKGNELDVLHDSCTGIFSALKTEPRQVPRIGDDVTIFHKSAWDRHDDPPLEQEKYWETIPLEKGVPQSVDIYARQHWNATRLFLEAGETYEFTASGEWLDADVKCGPDGPLKGNFNVGAAVQLAASAWGKAEGLFNRLVRNPKADFIGTKRYEDAPWFALIGVVANAAIQANPDELPEHQTFPIGSALPNFAPIKGGYLYCYANDAWQAYGNNRGSVRLTVKRR